MDFPYVILPGDPSVTPRPLVPVTYQYESKQTHPILTLIDSGADYSFAPFAIALYLGINFKRTKPVSITGFNQSKMDCFPKEITIEIAGRDLVLPVYFGGSLTQEYPCILGQDIFFDEARMIFERYQWSFGIEWKAVSRKKT